MKLFEEYLYNLSKKDLFSAMLAISEKLSINDFSQEELDELSDTTLFEQAQSRSTFIILVNNLAWQITENLCLILYAQQYNKNLIQNVNHWKVELRAYCKRIFKTNVTAGDKRKILEHTLLYHNELGDSDRVFELIEDKFLEEGIEIRKEKYAIYDVIEQFQEILKEDLIVLMSNKHNTDDFNINSYIEDL